MILQFGTGNFLRGFFDWMLQESADAGHDCGPVIMTTGTAHGNIARFSSKRWLVAERGVEERVSSVQVVSDCLQGAGDWQELKTVACDPDLSLIVSNTTEMGVQYIAEELTDACPESFPARLTALLHARYLAKLSGPVILPFELLEDNACVLKNIVQKHAIQWYADEHFIDWLASSCQWYNTLVDRIVSGFPGQHDVLGQQDANCVVCEPYHLLVIEGPPSLQDILPRTDGLILTDDLAPYRLRKVRCLNGVHTATAGLAIQSQVETVIAATQHPCIYEHIRTCLFDEIIPGLPGDFAENCAYGESVLNRFANPSLQHKWADIFCNSISKWCVRVLPSIRAAQANGREVPRGLARSLATLIQLYREQHPAVNDVQTLDQSQSLKEILENETVWGQPLGDDLIEAVLKL